MKRIRFLQVLSALMFSVRAFADTFSGRVTGVSAFRAAILALAPTALTCASPFDYVYQYGPFTVTRGSCTSGYLMLDGRMEESYTCSVFPDLSYRYLDNGYALEITGKSSVEAPLHPFLQAAWIAGDAFVDFQITLEGMPSDPADLFDFFSGPILGLSVIPTVETDGPFISYIHQFPWGSAQYPYWDSHIRIGAAHGGNVWPVKQESSFSFTLRPFLFTYDRMIPIRPILVGSERPEFIDTPEPAAWQLALVGLGLLAWRVKKPSFLRS